MYTKSLLCAFEKILSTHYLVIVEGLKDILFVCYIVVICDWELFGLLEHI